MNEYMKKAIQAGVQAAYGENAKDCGYHCNCEGSIWERKEATQIITAALPHIRAMIAEEIRAEMPPLRARQSGQTMRACLEYAAQIAEGKQP